MKRLDEFLDFYAETADLDVLNEITRRFMLRVPFENIDVQNQKPISVEVEDLLFKVVESRRGGYCYELNGLFHAYLESKGYDVSYSAATIKTPAGWNRPDSHMLSLVKIEGRTYIADVGFGDLPTQVIPLDGHPVDDVNGTYRAVTLSDEVFEVQKKGNTAYMTLYKAHFKPLEIKDFADALYFNQYSPDSLFVKKLLITQPKEDGRVTMTHDALTITKPGGKERKSVTAENYRTFLDKYFNLQVPIKRLEDKR